MEQKVILLDTDVLIDYLNKRIEVVEIVSKNLCFVHTVNKAELQQGCSSLPNLKKLNKSLQEFPIIELELSASKLFSKIFEQYVLSHGCRISDTLLAATALCFDVHIFTYNTKDFKYFEGLTFKS